MEVSAPKYSNETQNTEKPNAAAASFPPLTHRRNSNTPRPKTHPGRTVNAITGSNGTSRIFRKKRHTFRLPRHQEATAARNVLRTESRPESTSRGMGMSQVSHQCGCKP